MYQDILHYWFNEIDSKRWWKADPEFDQELTQRFLTILEQAKRGELASWRNSVQGRFAEIIVLDQFSRNIYRNTPAAFAQDGMALVLAQEAITHGAVSQLSPIETSFLYLPFMHSESAAIHVQAERMYKELGLQGNYEFELKHKVIIDRFGRYPHRNAILGRTSSAEEIVFLKQDGSHF
jgi:uncharacterized protein (DUF924 family)